MEVCKLPSGKHMYLDAFNHVIVITEDNKIYRYQLAIVNTYNNITILEQEKNKIKSENHIHHVMTNEILNKKLSPHILRLYDVIHCLKIPPSLFSRCNEYYDYLIANNMQTATCEKFFQRYPHKMDEGMYIQDVQFYQANLEVMLEVLTKKHSYIDIMKEIDLIVFQIIYTLETIKLKYPFFCHGNLSMNSISVNMIEQPDYDRYYFKDLIFDVPRTKCFCMINSFYLCALDKETAKKYDIGLDIYEDKYTDIMMLLTDIMGILMYFFPKNAEKIKKYFNEFFDSEYIDSIYLNKKIGLLNRGSMTDNAFVKKLRVKSGIDILKSFAKKLPQTKNKIIDHYGKTTI